MQIRAAAATHAGLVREQNEDSFHCGDAVFAVADGLGGHAAGEVASAIAVEPFRELDGRPLETDADARHALVDAVTTANRRVMENADASWERAGMGTTLTAAYLLDGRLLLAHVGDSRAYLLRAGALRRLTDDHTEAEEAVRQGLLTPEQAATHPGRNRIGRVVGLDADLDVDTPDPVDLRAGDRVLLASDGLTDAVGEDTVATVLGQRDDPRKTAEDLVSSALDGGGPDNVTVVVLHVQP